MKEARLVPDREFCRELQLLVNQFGVLHVYHVNWVKSVVSYPGSSPHILAWGGELAYETKKTVYSLT